MNVSMEWNWKDNHKDEWLDPSLESYYYANKWKHENKENILDLGCGLGRHTLLFKNYGFKVTACDLSTYSIDYMEKLKKERNLDIDIVKCDMVDLPFEKESFDAIFAFHVLSHTNTEGIYKIFKDIHKMLKPNGEVFFDILSKRAWIYSESNYPKLDENTMIAQDEAEYGIPHICLDYELIKDILKDYDILSAREVNEVYSNRLDNGRIHFYINARKK